MTIERLTSLATVAPAAGPRARATSIDAHLRLPLFILLLLLLLLLWLDQCEVFFSWNSFSRPVGKIYCSGFPRARVVRVLQARGR